VRALLWPHGTPPDGDGVSPWVDMRATPIEDLVAGLDAQQHRRFMKTHSPGDCLPFDRRCAYILVYRDVRDALASWANHRSKMRPEIVEVLNTLAANDGIAPLEPAWSGDLDELFEEWRAVSSPVRHLAGWWPRRHCENVLFVHYADLMGDVKGELARIAEFLDVRIDPGAWPGVVDRCGLDYMRASAEASGRLNQTFYGGAGSFFYKGGVGRWSDVLTPAQAARCEALAADGLSDEAAQWLMSGTESTGIIPHEVGEPPGEIATATAHPLARLRRTQVSAVQAISERRMHEAREQGLFDDLALAGTPIADIDTQRQPGWWAARFVQTERGKVRALELEAEVRSAMAPLWRLDTEDLVIKRVSELNTTIDTHNARAPQAHVTPIDQGAILTTWRRLQARGSD